MNNKNHSVSEQGHDNCLPLRCSFVVVLISAIHSFARLSHRVYARSGANLGKHLLQVLISVGVNLGRNTVVLATIMTHTIRNEYIIAYFNLEVMNRLGIFLLEVCDI